MRVNGYAPMGFNGKKKHRKAKIVATAGPACETPELIGSLMKAGVNVFRMNFSHGTHDWHRRVIETIRSQAENLDLPIAVMQDLQGPRLRTGRLKNGKNVELQKDARVSVRSGDFPGNADLISTDYAQMAEDVEPGGRILISDGLIELAVVKIAGKEVKCRVVTGGLLRENQGINLPGTELSITPPTEKDIMDLALGIECGVDYVAMSFVSRAEELLKLRAEMEKAAGSHTPAIVAKIERSRAVENLGEILGAADAVMVARGDLGIEMELEEVPPAQKHIINSANNLAIPVITATQMLDSMIRNPRPTRAETSDVANAILDGSDAVMLSGETAIGRYPLETVSMMNKIATRAETVPPEMWQAYHNAGQRATDTNHTRSLAASACSVALDVGAKAIAAFTMTGATAGFVAQHRTRLPVYALTPDNNTYRRLSMVWGVIPLKFPALKNTDDMIAMGRERMLKEGIAEAGDTLVCIAGPSTRTTGGTDMLKLLHF